MEWVDDLVWCVGYTFVASRKGKRQLLVDGHLFGCKEQRGERTYWTCTEYYKSGCPGRCVTFRGSLKVTGGQHNHPATTTQAQWPPAPHAASGPPLGQHLPSMADMGLDSTEAL